MVSRVAVPWTVAWYGGWRDGVADVGTVQSVVVFSYRGWRYIWWTVSYRGVAVRDRGWRFGMVDGNAVSRRAVRWMAASRMAVRFVVAGGLTYRPAVWWDDSIVHAGMV